ncbi:MAG: 4Fe-4S binding protein [Chloroflexaceae bacterium]|nr:4Fe-4S binding protein [Chloroflexaceae bacterium]
MPTLSLRKRIVIACGVAVALWSVGMLAWRLTGEAAPLVFFGYLGTVVAPGVIYYLGLPPHRRLKGRRAITLSLALAMFSAALARAVFQQSIVQVEGLVFEVLRGVFGAAVLHFLLAKLVGPLIFGRLYCGWACWTGTFLDLLPYRLSKGRLGGFWRRLPVVHLAASVILVTVLVLGFGYAPGPTGALVWFLGGCTLYYALGIGLALWLKDNRAFCKYACPAGVLARPAARYSLVKVAGDPTKCNGHAECIAVCPMDIRIIDYTRLHLRVLSADCILCQNCINVCPDGALGMSLGVETHGIELLRTR